MSPQYLSEIEVADRTHISLSTLRRWRLENRGPKFSKFGSLVRYELGDLAQWEQAQPTGGENIGRGFPPKSASLKGLLRKSG